MRFLFTPLPNSWGGLGEPREPCMGEDVMCLLLRGKRDTYLRHALATEDSI